jgi:hypothetical protein
MDNECPGGRPYIIVYTAIMVNWQLAFHSTFVFVRGMCLAGLPQFRFSVITLNPPNCPFRAMVSRGLTPG